MIYRLKSDRERFLIPDIDPDELAQKLGPDYFFMLAEPRWAGFWKDINIGFHNDSESGALPALPDVSVWFMSHLVLSVDARSRLELSLTEQGVSLDDLGELLPVSCEGIEYFLLHVTNTVEDEAIDIEASGRTVEASGHIEVAALAFNDDQIGAPLFHTSFDGEKGLFCTESFKAMLESLRLSGLVFDEYLASIF